MAAGHDEYVAGCHRLKVHERDGSFVFMNDARLKFPGDETAEDTVIRCSHTRDGMANRLSIDPSPDRARG